MQLMFAATFLLAAGLVFTILSLIPRARRWAIPIPTGILAAGPSAVLAIALQIPFRGAVHEPAPESWRLWVIVAAIAGIIGGLIAGLIAWPLAGSLPKVLLRAAVFMAAWCSYLVVLFAAELTGSYFGWPRGDWSIVFVLEALLSFTGAFFIAKRSEDFRPRYFRLPWGTPFNLRARARRGPQEKLNATPDRAPAVPHAAPEDRL
jgi:hypothetical protein